jgi:hypothetical protein
MFAALAKLREIQTMRSLSPAFYAQLAPPKSGWTLEALLVLDIPALRRELAGHLASPRRGHMLPALGLRGT